MKYDEIYFWGLFVVSILLFIYALANIPESVLTMLKGAT